MTDVAKKTMQIAMVGVSPADQITLKGYVRVLLRLDVELEWVSAQVQGVDLYVINQDFKTSPSVQRLLHASPQTAVLYVSRSEMGDGFLKENLLVLPLKQINVLNDWLHEKVGILKGIPYQKSVIIAPEPTAPVAQPTPQPAPTPKREIVSKPVEELNGLVEVIKTLHARQKTNVELLQSDELLAIIDPSRQVVWLKSAKVADVRAWRLRPYQGQLPSTTPLDLNQWLYQTAWANADKISPLIQNSTLHHIRSWAKPDDNGERRTALRVMTALEKTPKSADEIASLTGIDKNTIKKVMASLLVAQHLADSSYQNIQAVIQEETVKAETTVAPVAPVSTPENEEKLGFLARLRRKLGI